MGDLLCHAVIGNLKILGLQVVDHLPASIADGHRGVHQRDLHLHLWLSVPGRLLHANAGLRRATSGGTRGTGAVTRVKHKSQRRCTPSTSPWASSAPKA